MYLLLHIFESHSQKHVERVFHFTSFHFLSFKFLYFNFFLFLEVLRKWSWYHDVFWLPSTPHWLQSQFFHFSLNSQERERERERARERENQVGTSMFLPHLDKSVCALVSIQFWSTKNVVWLSHWKILRPRSTPQSNNF